jgi:hypothetical protein
MRMFRVVKEIRMRILGLDSRQLANVAVDVAVVQRLEVAPPLEFAESDLCIPSLHHILNVCRRGR